jgi:hypothetical protein
MRRFFALVMLAVTACATPAPSTQPSPTPGGAGSGSMRVTPSPSIAAASRLLATAAPGTPRPATAAAGWQPVPIQESVQRAPLDQVVWTGTRFVATSSGNASLDSADGRTWHLQGALAGADVTWGLAAGPLGIVAVGEQNGRAASWASPDGLRWTAGPDQPSLRGAGTDGVLATAVVAAPWGWLAVGSEDPACRGMCGQPVRAIVWTSPDGLRWTRVPDQPSFANAAMTGVARWGQGFVAVGSVALGQTRDRAAVWTSPDGRAWSLVPDVPLFQLSPGTDMTGVAAGHDLLVAVGTMAVSQGFGVSAVAWWSDDGRTWQRATGDRFLGGQLFSVTSTPEGFLATGPSGEPSCSGGIWSSADGRSWTCIASDPAFAGFCPYAAAASLSVEVVVGLFNGESPAPGAIWWRGIP